jgi:phosphoglycolate phosphatase-like HAD superfamily hydrolase
MTPLVVLFDIDGTLITSGGSGRRALEKAFSAHYACENLFADFGFGGMTDKAILREGFRRLGKELDAVACDALLETYVRALSEELAASKDYRLHLGMKEAVAALRNRPNTAVGLGTGKIVAGAEAKLAPLGAYDWFSFGGFGSDHEDRGELIRIGIERGKAHLRVAKARCVIIGDTPKDIDAARKNGAEVICVTTGQFKNEELAHADHVFDTIDDPRALAILLR